jgi:hypothetical protein
MFRTVTVLVPSIKETRLYLVGNAWVHSFKVDPGKTILDDYCFEGDHKVDEYPYLCTFCVSVCIQNFHVLLHFV